MFFKFQLSFQRGFSRSCQRYNGTKRLPSATHPPLDSQVPAQASPARPRRGRPPKSESSVSSGPNQVAVSGLEGLGLLNHPASPTRSLKPQPAAEPRWTPDASGGNFDLPPPSEWRRHFNLTHHGIRERVCVRNPLTADTIAASFIPPGSLGKVVIEAFPGPGALTRSLLMLPKSRIHKLIILETYEPYLECLRPLERLDSRVHVIPMDAYSWDTYQAIEDKGLLDDVTSMPWDAGVHKKLHFIGHLPHNITGEQLIAQLLRSIPEKSWLFKYGRVPLNFVLSQWVWERIHAGPKDQARCKLSVVAQATSQFSEALPLSVLQPYEDNFHPNFQKTGGWSTTPENRRSGMPFAAISITPSEEQVIEPGMLEQWDYCLRRLFVLKAKPLKSAISHLAPGAESLLKKLPDGSSSSPRFNINRPIREMTVTEWAQLLRVFDDWPFAPEDLSINDSFTKDNRRA